MTTVTCTGTVIQRVIYSMTKCSAVYDILEMQALSNDSVPVCHWTSMPRESRRIG
jgi:hypothetical protein